MKQLKQLEEEINYNKSKHQTSSFKLIDHGKAVAEAMKFHKALLDRFVRVKATVESTKWV